MESEENPRLRSKSPKASKAPKSPNANEKKGERTAKLSREQLLIALQRKKACNARAQKIVEEYLDPVPEEKVDEFIRKIAHINQSHFEDIVEERAITKLCGYPLCSIQLTDVPQKQYHISMTQNKVYDITVRKNFCSNKCYKSAEYLKEQLLTTPLWVRKEDDILPEFKLLSP